MNFPRELSRPWLQESWLHRDKCARMRSTYRRAACNARIAVQTAWHIQSQHRSIGLVDQLFQLLNLQLSQLLTLFDSLGTLTPLLESCFHS